MRDSEVREPLNRARQRRTNRNGKEDVRPVLNQSERAKIFDSETSPFGSRTGQLVLAIFIGFFIGALAQERGLIFTHSEPVVFVENAQPGSPKRIVKEGPVKWAKHYPKRPLNEWVNLITSEKYKFIWIKPTKTAGSMLLKIFIDNLCKGQLEHRPNGRTDRVQCPFEIMDNYYLNKSFPSEEVWMDYFVFGYAREPSSRANSMYNYANIQEPYYQWCNNTEESSCCGIESFAHCAPLKPHYVQDNQLIVDFVADTSSFYDDLHIIIKKIKQRTPSFEVDFSWQQENNKKANKKKYKKEEGRCNHYMEDYTFYDAYKKQKQNMIDSI